MCACPFLVLLSHPLPLKQLPMHVWLCPRSADAGWGRAQRDRLHELFQAHKAEKDMLDRIADELPGGLKRSQVAAQLRKLGLRRPRAGKSGGTPAAGAEVRANSL